MKELRWKSAIPIALVSFFILLAVNVAWIRSNVWYQMPAKPFSDGLEYEAIGWGLNHGLGLSSHYSDPGWRSSYANANPDLYAGWVAQNRPIVPRTDRPPLLPVVIAGIYSVFGATPTAFASIRIFLAVCLAASGAISVLIAFVLADRIKPLGTGAQTSKFVLKYGPYIAALICFAIAVAEHTIKTYMEDFLTELPAMFLTQLFLVALLVINAQERPKWSLVVAGVLFGLMFYARSLFILWTPALFIAIAVVRYCSLGVDQPTALPRNRLKRASLESLAIFTVAAIVIAPWCIRNCIVLHKWMPLGTKGTITLLGGYCDEAYNDAGNWQNTPERHWRDVLEKSFGSELETSPQANIQLELELVTIARREVKNWISSNVDKLPALAAKRLYSNFNPYHGLSALVKLCALFGLIIALRQFPRPTILLFAPIVINAAVVACLYSVGGRFLVPLYGVIYVFCAIGAAYVVLSAIQLMAGDRSHLIPKSQSPRTK